MEKKKNKRALAATTAIMIGASTIGCGTGSTDGALIEDTGVDTSSYPLTPETAGEGDVKWSEETTSDGWIKVTNEGGETLGYSPDSGVQILQYDGYAFKDLNQNGKIDAYEDWRLDDKTRAVDLATQLPVEQIFGLMLHGDMGSIEADGSDASNRDGDKFSELMEKGVRSTLNRSAGSTDNKLFATWNNNAQATAEALDYGVPVSISSNPGIEYVNDLALAATFDPEVVEETYVDASKMYRAIGVSTLLGPQADLATEPRWNRIDGTFGEDPALVTDMINSAISGLQSTYSEDGEDLGWGTDSVVAMMKHFPGDGAGEAGRESHSESGKYTVYPNDGFETLLIPFIDGGLNLESATEESAAAMTSYSIAYSDTQEYGDLVGTAFSNYKIGLLRDDNNYDGLLCSDWFILKDYTPGGDLATPWGMEDATEAERMAAAFEAGLDQIGGCNSADFEGAYKIMQDDLGKDEAENVIRKAAMHITLTYFKSGLFENAYVDVNAANEIVSGFKSSDRASEIEASSIVMLKNSDNTIKATDGSTEKLTVYVPMVYSAGGWDSAAGWSLPIDEEELSKTYNIVTDTLGEPTGEADADGNATYTTDDIIRATASDLANVDMALCIINNPVNYGSEATGYGYDGTNYYPISLQYGEYTADSDSVRKQSISGNTNSVDVEDPYGGATALSKENRSYYGNSSEITNTYELDAVLNAADNIPSSAKLVVCVNADAPMIFSEFEDKADAILMGFGINNSAFLDIVNGNVEPTGLLPLQMPLNMETVEAQAEDTPRDMECYVDSDGNTYDFGFGLNYSGVISDERTEKYCVEPVLSLSK
ncbi:MAG: glycoside hydrolase family 3 C-terminal domain-containing protein [Pseudobutyrivibrio sp.]|nr:glycoside hydrolase family 3 C-terminal domain-containing protein [Pseudobutyrivibrio sp.]